MDVTPFARPSVESEGRARSVHRPRRRHKYGKNSLGKKNRTAEEDQALDQEIARLNQEAQDERGPFRLLDQPRMPDELA